MDGHRLFVLWRSAVEVANQKTTMIAATSAAFGAMQQISSRTILPTGIWWLAAFILLFASAMIAGIRGADQSNTRTTASAPLSVAA